MTDKPTKLERLCPEITAVVAELGGRMRMYGGRYFVPELHRCFYESRVQGSPSERAAWRVLQELQELRDASAKARAIPLANRAASVMAKLYTVGWVAPQHYAEVTTDALDVGHLHHGFGMWDGSVSVVGESARGASHRDKAEALASLADAVAKKWGAPIPVNVITENE